MVQSIGFGMYREGLELKTKIFRSLVSSRLAHVVVTLINRRSHNIYRDTKVKTLWLLTVI